MGAVLIKLQPSLFKKKNRTLAEPSGLRTVIVAADIITIILTSSTKPVFCEVVAHVGIICDNWRAAVDYRNRHREAIPVDNNRIATQDGA